MKMTKMVVTFLVFMTCLTCLGCTTESNTSEPAQSGINSSIDEISRSESGDNLYSSSAYYCDRFHTPPKQPCRISIADGSVFVPCPDPLCTHTDETTCPFYNGICFEQLNAGRWFFYLLYRTSPREYPLYVFDMLDNSTRKIYDFEKIPDNLDLIFDDGKLYFNSPVFEQDEHGFSEKNIRNVMCYDVNTHDLRLFGICRRADRMQFAENGKVCYYSWPDQGPQVPEGFFLASGDFNPFLDEPLEIPEGSGWTKADLFIRLYPTRGMWMGVDPTSGLPLIYLTDEKKYLKIPKDPTGGSLSSFSRTGNTFYASLWDGERWGKSDFYLNKDDPLQSGYFKNVVYVIDINGNAARYTVTCDYPFAVMQGYGDSVIAEIYGKYSNGTVLNENELDENTLRINLKTGECDIFNTAAQTADKVFVGSSSVHISEEHVSVE